ncbi:MAG: hypothetical protein HOL01_13940, partial [Planctomycetaceae bacterium]|nr:hypothetical protein [Planctomycetaceae bacterium]
MSVKQTLLIIALPFALSSFAVADEPVKQPEPLEKVTVDLGLLKEHFKVVNYKLYQSGEFKSLGNPRRKISEQALVWTLQAKADLTGKQAAGFFERPAFPRVRFYS